MMMARQAKQMYKGPKIELVEKAEREQKPNLNDRLLISRRHRLEDRGGGGQAGVQRWQESWA